MQIKVRWLVLAAYGYLLIPFVIFCLGFLRLSVAIPVASISIWVYIRLFLREQSSQEIVLKRSDLIIGVIILIIWVWLSGSGGFAYQNCDYHARNAIFRDLVNQKWPVVYYGGLNNAVENSVGYVYSLVYYIGFWLPAALVGKLLGWQAAEITLFIWTFIGVLITVLLIQKVIVKSLIHSILLIVLFSGMDLVGASLLSMVVKNTYPQIWPPITHLEWWAHYFQFSSFTTQLFWVFNQSIPAWICIALHMAAPNRKRAILLWSLCFFFSPIPSVGFLPFVIMEFPKRVFNPHQFRFDHTKIHLITSLKNFWIDLREALSHENIIGGGMIIFVTFLYYSANQASSTIQFFSQDIISKIVYPFFILIEGLFLWLALKNKLSRDLEWYAVGLFLIAVPMIRIGYSIDFSMRASIPALFVLMVWVGREVTDKKWSYRQFVIVCLVIGSITPIYEINRSLYKTIYFMKNSDYYSDQTKPSPQAAYNTKCIPEKDHPNSLLADDFYSLNNFSPTQMQNYISRLDGSLYQRYLFKNEKGND